MTSGRGPALGARLYSAAMLYREDYRRLLRAGGLAVWLAVGVPVARPAASRTPAHRDEFALGAWVAALLLFGVAFWRATAAPRDERPSPKSSCSSRARPRRCSPSSRCLRASASKAHSSCSRRSSSGPILPRPAATAWIAAQSVGLLWLMWLHWGWHWGVVLAFAYLPFQFIADATARLLAQETALRQGLAASHAELEATRELLAQSARLAERARIARDLHDLLGHHLTALSLNLEIASHKAAGEARERIATAQSVTKLLLGDVRGVVGALRGDDHLDLPAALRKLADGIPRPRVHVEASAGLAIDDPAVGEVVLRCAQEIVTNAVRHARAENLWLDVERPPKASASAPATTAAERRICRCRAGSRARRPAGALRATRRRGLLRHRSGRGFPGRRRSAAPGSERVIVIRVFLVEDQTLVREGIRSLLALDPEIAIAGEAADGDEAAAAIPRSGADVVLLDMRLPRLLRPRGAPRAFGRGRPSADDHPDDVRRRRAAPPGSSGRREGLSAQGRVSRRARPRDPRRGRRRHAVSRSSPNGWCAGSTPAPTRRFRAWSRGSADGARNGGPAADDRRLQQSRDRRALRVAEGTVKNHVSSILSKLGVRDRTRAVLQAVRAGYLA